MTVFYPLKIASPTQFVEPVSHYLEKVESPEKSHLFREVMQQITLLRNKVTSLVNYDGTIECVNKYINAIEMYVRLARLMAQHLNWNKEFGETVEGLTLTWQDSFNPSLTCTKGEIDFDIFCCYYNLGVLYFQKSYLLAKEDLMSVWEESARSAKIAAYLFNRMRTYYYHAFMNSGFIDTNYSHLDMLQSMAMGIVYKNVFRLVKDDEFNKGVDNVALIAGLAQKHYFRAYQLASAYFMKTNAISPNLKLEILSFTYVQSLYHDLQFNIRYAKFYKEVEMDKAKNNIVNLIAYERKALRLLVLGLQNESVQQLLNKCPQEKGELTKIRPRLEQSLKQNILKNQKIYKCQEIKEEKNIPPPKDLPAGFISALKEPDSLKVNYTGSVAAPFESLSNNESRGFENDLKQFVSNRMTAMQSSYTKLKKNVEEQYNNSYVNYYLNLEQNNKNKGISQVLKQKITQIKNNGGKQKLDIQVKILRNNAEQACGRLERLREMLVAQQTYDKFMRNKYRQKWIRQDSSQLNRTMMQDLILYSQKTKKAIAANANVIQKYTGLEKYIGVVDQDQEKIMSVLPKVEINKFLEANKGLFEKLRGKVGLVKGRLEELEQISKEIKRFYDKIDLKAMANKYYRDLKPENRQQIFAIVFGEVYKLIQSFNQKTKQADAEAKRAGNCAAELNSKNKGGDEKAKNDFEQVMSKFNGVCNLLRDLSNGTAFFTKLAEIVVKMDQNITGFTEARRIEAKDLEAMINKGQGGNNGGYGGGGNLPQMYPGQAPQQPGFYIPPPISLQLNTGSSQANYQHQSIEDLLKGINQSNLNVKSQDIFAGQVSISTYHR